MIPILTPESSVIVAEFFRIFLIFTMFFAAMGKFFTFNTFKEDLATSFRITSPWNHGLAMLVICIEVLIGIALLFNDLILQLAVYAILFLIGIFTMVVFYFLFNSGSVKCSCFGQKSQRISYWDFIKNFVILFAGVWVLIHFNNSAIEPVLHYTLGCFALLLFILICNINNIVLMARIK
ncbi:MAG: hypothetical protein ACI9T7_000402 [Oleiphilaceae bacterium]|jgi:hypothetical protein